MCKAEKVRACIAPNEAIGSRVATAERIFLPECFDPREHVYAA